MAWCRQKTSHFLSQYWLGIKVTYGINLRSILQEVIINWTCNGSLQITCLKPVQQFPGSAPGLESMAPPLVLGMGDNNTIDKLWYWYRVLSLMQTKQLIHSKRKDRLRNSLPERSRYFLILCRWIIRVSLVSAVGTNILVSFHRG